MAARDKKTSAGGGPKKSINTSSPVPLRESNLQTPSDPLTENTLSDLPEPLLEPKKEPKERPELSLASIAKIDATLNAVIARATEEASTPPPPPVNETTEEDPPLIKIRKKPGRKPGVSLIRNRLNLELKAKNKTGRRNISKKLATAAKLEFAQSPEKKVALLKRGFRGKIKTDDEGDKIPKRRRKIAKKVEQLQEEEENKKTRKLVRKLVGQAKRESKKLLSVKEQEVIDSIAKDTELDSDAQNVINQLDLNVDMKKEVKIKKRRHSIEKTALNDNEVITASALPPDFATFISARSESPRSKRRTKPNRSPYTTRSDSPARLLRNGKHRKLKDLLDGLQSDRKRRRVFSDSKDLGELNKNSEYWSESESSYCESTVSAMENGVPDIADVEPTKVEVASVEVDEVKTEVVSVESETKVKVSEVMDTENNNEVLEPLKLSDDFSSEVTEKIMILNQMAQNFNGVQEDGVCEAEPPHAEEAAAVQTNGLSLTSIITEDPLIIPITETVAEVEEKPEIITEPLILDTPEEPERPNEEEIEIPIETLDEKPDEEIIEPTETEKTAVESLPCTEEPSDFTNKISSDNSLDPSDNAECNNSSSDIGNNSSIHLKLEDSSFDDEEDLKLALDETTQGFDDVEDKPDLEEQNIELKDISDDKIEDEPPVLEPMVELPVKDDEPQPSCSSEGLEIPSIVETPENQAIKESILNALGLQSLKAAAEAKVAHKSRRGLAKTDPYTGTLKTVIKLNRSPGQKKGRGQLKMTFQKSKGKGASAYSNGNDGFGDAAGSSPDDNTYYKVMTEDSANWNTGGQSSDTAGANRKSHYSSNRSNTDGSSDHMSDDGCGEGEDANAGKGKTLVIPEKASSFSIHPHRLCRDECCYCFGRFGLFDTPCHIGQIKNTERQQKILAIEKHLTTDSCLCDACYRHVDRKANNPLYEGTRKQGYKRSVVPGTRICHANNCGQDATHTVRRKWVLKMKRNFSQVQFDLDPQHNVHLIPVCEAHYESLEKLMICAMCKRKLARNCAHNINSPEAEILNGEFEKRKLPILLSTAKASTSTDSSEDKGGGSTVCKLCRYFATLLLKPPDNARPHTLSFFETYEKRLLHFHNVKLEENLDEEDPSPPAKEKVLNKRAKRAKLSKTKQTDNNCVNTKVYDEDELKTDILLPETDPIETNKETDSERISTDQRVPLTNENNLDDNITEPRSNSPLNNKQTDSESVKTEVPNKPNLVRRNLPKDQQKYVELHKKKQQNQKVVEKLETNPSISISVRQLFPGEEELPLRGCVEFGNVKERTPEGWEKCNMTIQYDHDTKRLWQELQKPYGNHSSFLRHLVFLEKYFRNGDLLLAPAASHHATNYCESVQNRLRAYDNIPSGGVNMQPMAMLPFNTQPVNSTPMRRPSMSQSGIITGKSLAPKTSTPTIPGTSIAALPPNFISPVNVMKQRPPSIPPGLIQLQSSRQPPSTLLRIPQTIQTNKIKLPTTQHPNRIQKIMRPTLIPFTQNKLPSTTTSGALNTISETERFRLSEIERKRRQHGVVQVISNGKSYQLSLQDYNRMCALKQQQQQQREGIDLAPISKKMASTGVSLSTVSVLRQRSPVTTQSTIGSAVSLSEVRRDEGDKKVMILPKIPKSLTVIPQTVRKSSTESQSANSSPHLSVVSLNNKPS